MDTKFFNIIEIMNESFVLMTGYYMLLFTDIVPDVEVRYSIGEVFFNKVIAILILNVLVIATMMIIGLVKAIQLRLKKRRIRLEFKKIKEQRKYEFELSR